MNKGGNHQWYNDALEHVEEELPDVLHIHRLPPGPGLILVGPETQAKPNT